MRTWLGLICVVLGLAAAGAAIACSCVRYRSAEEQFREADVVFIGRVTGFRPIGDGAVGLTTFRVIRTLKGRPAQVQTLRHRVHSDGSCGIRFSQDFSGVVIGRWNGRTLTTNSCTAAQFPVADFERAARTR